MLHYLYMAGSEVRAVGLYSFRIPVFVFVRPNVASVATIFFHAASGRDQSDADLSECLLKFSSLSHWLQPYHQITRDG